MVENDLKRKVIAARWLHKNESIKSRLQSKPVSCFKGETVVKTRHEINS